MENEQTQNEKQEITIEDAIHGMLVRIVTLESVIVLQQESFRLLKQAIDGHQATLEALQALQPKSTVPPAGSTKPRIN